MRKDPSDWELTIVAASFATSAKRFRKELDGLMDCMLSRDCSDRKPWELPSPAEDARLRELPTPPEDSRLRELLRPPEDSSVRELLGRTCERDRGIGRWLVGDSALLMSSPSLRSLSCPEPRGNRR